MNAPRLVHPHCRATLARFLHRAPLLHLYELCDLDDRLWGQTLWTGLQSERGELEEVVLLYRGLALPTLIAMRSAGPDRIEELLESVRPLLPRRFYLHASPDAEVPLRQDWDLVPRGRYLRMSYTVRSLCRSVDTSLAEVLGPANADEVRAFYAQAYPENFFDAAQLATGVYRGVRRDGRLVAVGGVHAYAPSQGAAALGNIATHPEYRGQGLGRVVTAATIHALGDTQSIGLNVQLQNDAAKSLYTSLGFLPVAHYDEWLAQAKS